MINASLPPKKNQIELSLFANGYGESILVHVGNNKWVVIDSCINPNSKKCIITDYLNEIGVELENIRYVFLSHFHQDHTLGLYELLKSSSHSKLFISAALKQREFFILIESAKKIRKSGIDEFSRIYDLLCAESPRRIEYVLANSYYNLSDSISNCEIFVLSPSSKSFSLSLSEIADLLTEPHKPLKKIVKRTPNHYSIVLLMVIDDNAILLGSDLEVTSDKETGWHAILLSENKPLIKSEIFKIPHHGSENAYLKEVWKLMLHKEPISIISTFNCGSTCLPSETVLTKISRHTDKLYIAGDLSPKSKYRIHDRTLKRTLSEGNIKLRKVYNKLGHIRIRKNKNESDWNIDLIGNSMKYH